MTKAVIFDLGNTLVSYYTSPQWPEILPRCLAETAGYLYGLGLGRVADEEVASRAQAERGERDDHRVRPLEDRLTRIFGLRSFDLDGEKVMEMCRRFLRPIFALGRRYDDVLPVLEEVRRRGIRTGILSNTPWGSPAEPWRQELARHQLAEAVDCVAFCRDVGWRKPAAQPFEFVAGKLDAPAGQCLFVGDDPRWDIAGPRAIGMPAVLIDRSGSPAPQGGGERPIRSLGELLGLL